MKNPLEKLAPTFEQSSKLFKYWPEGKETVFVWEDLPSGPLLQIRERGCVYMHPAYPAPTLQELWDFIPDEFTHEGDVYEKWLSWGGAFAYVVEGSNAKSFMCSAPHASPLESIVKTILEHEVIQKQLK